MNFILHRMKNLLPLFLLLICSFQGFGQHADICASDNGKLYGIQLPGRTLLNPEYRRIELLYWGWEEMYAVENEEGKMAIYNTNKESLSPFIFNKIGNYMDVDFPVDQNGNWISSSTFENDYLCDGVPFNIIEETEIMRTTYVDENATYTHKVEHHLGRVKRAFYANVITDRGSGVVNELGELVLEGQFDSITPFGGDFNQTCWAYKGSTLHLLNAQFNPVNSYPLTLIIDAPFSGSKVLLLNEPQDQHFTVLNSLGELVCSIPKQPGMFLTLEYVGDYEFLVINDNGIYSAIFLFTPERCIVISDKRSEKELYDALNDFAMDGW
jgi:hypothetical protein